MNWLVMPHARITVKRSACLSPALVNQWLDSLRAIARPGGPVPKSSDAAGRVLVADYRPGQVKTSRSDFGCYASAKNEAFGALNAALKFLSTKLEITYLSYPPVED